MGYATARSKGINFEIMQTVNILGTEYTIEYGTEEDFPKLANADGYFDKTTKRIVISVLDCLDDPMRIEDLQYYQNKVVRHEIIHAAMYESGLGENANWNDEHFEQLTDWIAIQSPKLFKIFDELGILE